MLQRKEVWPYLSCIKKCMLAPCKNTTVLSRCNLNIKMYWSYCSVLATGQSLFFFAFCLPSVERETGPQSRAPRSPLRLPTVRWTLRTLGAVTLVLFSKPPLGETALVGLTLGCDQFHLRGYTLFNYPRGGKTWSPFRAKCPCKH